jgi:SlyX protein
MDGISEERIIDLETRYTHLQRLFEELSDVVARQQTVIDGLVSRLGSTIARLDQAGPSQSNDRPPHY